MRHICVFLLSAVALAAEYPAPAHEWFHYGAAVYTYGPEICTQDVCDVVPSCNTAHWADDIRQFNEKYTDGQMNIVYSYGGDIELWPKAGGDIDKAACHAPANGNCNSSAFFDPNNVLAAGAYKKVTAVDTIVALIDGRMDGWDQITTYNKFDGCDFGDFYPNMANLTDAQLDKLALDTAKLYCKSDLVSSVQIDLEPYRPPYAAGISKYVSKLAGYLLDEAKTTGCRNSAFPEGRGVSYFCFAHDVVQYSTLEDNMFDAIVSHPNGYFVFSGYDLFPKNDAFAYNTPSEFKEKLTREITYIQKVIEMGKKKYNRTVRFTMGLPLGGTCHEYEQYVPMHGEGCGPSCKGYTNPAVMSDYINAYMDVLTDAKYDNFFHICSNTQSFLGPAFWSYSHTMSYPPMKWFDNQFLPASPTPDAVKTLGSRLHELSACPQTSFI